MVLKIAKENSTSLLRIDESRKRRRIMPSSEDTVMDPQEYPLAIWLFQQAATMSCWLADFCSISKCVNVVLETARG